MTPASPRSSTLTTPSDREIHIERIFQASQARLWQAYTDPAHVKQWWGRGHPLTVEQFDLRPGGHWRVVERTPTGEVHGFEGRFRAIAPPDRLEMTFDWDGAPGHVSVQTITFTALDADRTRVTTHVQFLTAAERDAMLTAGMEGGMNESYAHLDTLLASSR